MAEERKKKGYTQKELAKKLYLSDKAISKWERGKGLPDIGIIEELARALRVSLPELLTGDLKTNENVSGNMKKIQFYVCPICGNMITAVGEGQFSCCGVSLPRQGADSVEIVKLYPEQDISIRFRKKGHGMLYAYCNRHGLFRKAI